jgi:methylphosphotriester-DNA--protein-cysteine methyltransferase
MKQHIELSPNVLRSQIRSGEIKFGGNRKLKIYGLLHCSSGKKMKQENRVFFKSEKEALENNYRPCGHCMKEKYKQWKIKENCLHP